MIKLNIYSCDFCGHEFATKKDYGNTYHTSVNKCTECYGIDFTRIATQELSAVAAPRTLIDEVLCRRLVEQFKLHGKLLIAFDYDDTVFPYYVEDNIVKPNIDLLVRAQEQGHVLLLYTCRDVANDNEVAKYLKTKGLDVKWMNAGPLPAEAGAKLFYNVLLDDKCGIDFVRSTVSAALDIIDILLKDAENGIR